ncbi:unnamed protein product [Natator depressus]
MGVGQGWVEHPPVLAEIGTYEQGHRALPSPPPTVAGVRGADSSLSLSLPATAKYLWMHLFRWLHSARIFVEIANIWLFISMHIMYVHVSIWCDVSNACV